MFRTDRGYIVGYRTNKNFNFYIEADGKVISFLYTVVRGLPL